MAKRHNGEITPDVAVERLINCFETANEEINKALNQKIPKKELEARVKLFVGDAFRKCNVDINNPTKEGLKQAMNLCKINTEKMLGPKAEPIIKKHYKEMSEIIEKLPSGKND
ncbi:MAG: hypothetical protein QW814_02555 [Methanothrix sp.]